MKTKPIYVEIDMDTEMDRIWNASQQPELHSQWDLRFSSIKYLPKKDGEPQKFTYTRKVAPFITVEGWGKSVGSRNEANGPLSSSLHFGTDQWFSPIKEGKGYWKYIQQDNGIKFLTQYDYSPNFSGIGKMTDKVIFRPLIGWATALSFDVLKRWLEKGEAPRSQYLRFFITYGLTVLFSLVWLYQGLMPKIIARHPEEFAMVQSVFSESHSTGIVLGIGIAEILFGFLWLFYKRKKRLFAFQLAVFPLLTVSAIFSVPETAMHPFNPIMFNLALIALSLIGYFSSEDVPTAKSCKRKR